MKHFHLLTAREETTQVIILHGTRRACPRGFSGPDHLPAYRSSIRHLPQCPSEGPIADKFLRAATALLLILYMISAVMWSIRMDMPLFSVIDGHWTTELTSQLA
ncbi:hypothetical protein LX36DRAFT_674371 [Colletotrichum falcatum]|nr:hypothetical protein LX36DRAFT_674371 [Colletotrichum falcatum]